MGRELRRAAWAAAAMTACACAAGSTGSPLALYPASAEGPGARVRGTLRLEGDCLYLVGEGGDRWLAAFPAPGSTWNAAERAVQVGEARVRAGEAGEFGGGEAGGPGIAWVQAPAAACDASRIWMVTTVGG